MHGLEHMERRLEGVMAILRSAKRTGADKDECPLCWGHQADAAEPEEYSCVAVMTGNVCDYDEYVDPGTVLREQ